MLIRCRAPKKVRKPIPCLAFRLGTPIPESGHRGGPVACAGQSVESVAVGNQLFLPVFLKIETQLFASSVVDHLVVLQEYIGAVTNLSHIEHFAKQSAHVRSGLMSERVTKFMPQNTGKLIFAPCKCNKLARDIDPAARHGESVYDR
ncbi:MAG TPA: hypothetical protein VFW31_17440 [Candidatus Angelobacter sp.]|nr:hypothetical protein [Candidatus Angelobacter sp.]